MTYDRNGNLLSLQRTSDGSERNDFSYTYDGNRLTALTDGPQTYSYACDSDGNRTRDGLHGLEITYNRLNLIEKITRNGATLANYSYLSDGTKLAATDAAGDGLRYIGSLVYRKLNGNLSLESAAVEGGRIVAAQTARGTAFLPRYHIADHLGSVRAVVGPGGEVLQQSDYYPFGLRHENPSLAASDNRYGYNGKERQEFLASPYIDYGARQYDPVEARWFDPDPLARFYHPISPYAFCMNNPLFYIDPDGRMVDWIRNKHTGQILWNDNVTSPELTPEHYTYVGKNDEDILDELNINKIYKRKSATKTGAGGNGDKRIGVAIFTKTYLHGTLTALAKVSYAQEHATPNNQAGRQFEGVEFHAVLEQSHYNPDTDTKAEYFGTLNISYGNKTYYDYLRFVKGSFIEAPNASYIEASILFPAARINILDPFYKATISSGTTNPSLMIRPSANIFEWKLMRNPIIYQKND